MEKAKYEAYQEAVALLRANANPDQKHMCDDIVELFNADPNLAIEFMSYQLTNAISALLANNLLHRLGQDDPEDTEH